MSLDLGNETGRKMLGLPVGPRADSPDDLLEVLPAHEAELAVDERSLLGLAELFLKRPARLDDLARDEARLHDLIPRFLAISLASVSAFGVSLSLLLGTVPSPALPSFLAEHWSSAPLASAVSLVLAYTLGLVAATGVCLPSFYFYSLLAGVRVSVLQVTAHILKGKSATSIMLLGILPIYVALVLGMIVFEVKPPALTLALYLGLALPFVAGLWGMRTIYHGFLSLADTLPAERRCRRTCFLRRLTVSCSLCYSAVTPVMIYTLWNYFARLLA